MYILSPKKLKFFKVKKIFISMIWSLTKLRNRIRRDIIKINCCTNSPFSRKELGTTTKNNNSFVGLGPKRIIDHHVMNNDNMAYPKITNI